MGSPTSSRYLECLYWSLFDLPWPSLSFCCIDLPKVDLIYPRLSLIAYSRIYSCFVFIAISLAQQPILHITSLHQVLNLASLVLVVRSPTYHYTSFSSIRVFTSIFWLTGLLANATKSQLSAMKMRLIDFLVGFFLICFLIGFLKFVVYLFLYGFQMVGSVYFNACASNIHAQIGCTLALLWYVACICVVLMCRCWCVVGV